MKFLILLSSLTFFLAISGCSSLQNVPQKNIKISWKEPHKLYFLGKGAGAGMALMSTMGAMGMAIGVAIDEGISKEISKTQQQSNNTIKALLNEAAHKNGYQLIFAGKQNTGSTEAYILIERIEFNIVRGANDATALKINARLTNAAGITKHINYPKDFPKHSTPSVSLEQLKKDSSAANQLLSVAFEALLNKQAEI